MSQCEQSDKSRQRLSPEGGQYAHFRWIKVHNRDELEKFYREIVDPLKRAARELGYALAVHGSMRRDLDAIAVPWGEDHADKDDLARALQNAACGLWQAKYQWEAKPCGRFAVSFPICWTERSPDFEREENLGHIDLSLMPAVVPSSTAVATPTIISDLAYAEGFLSEAAQDFGPVWVEVHKKVKAALEHLMRAPSATTFAYLVRSHGECPQDWPCKDIPDVQLALCEALYGRPEDADAHEIGQYLAQVQAMDTREMRYTFEDGSLEIIKLLSPNDIVRE